MGERLGVRAMQAGVAVACAMAALGALAQSAPTPQAIIERAQSTGVVAGLQRALGTPLEIVWLRTAAEVVAWTGDGLAGATVGRTGWRYIFGGNAQFAPAPNEVARLVVSSLTLLKAPLSAGTLGLSGTGRLFIISPEAPGRALPAQAALVLAAGSTLQVSDTAAPGLQIEIKAPERRPLLLGNLASASVRRMLALLVKPDAVNASAASLEAGRIALRSGGEIELAAIVDGRTEPSTAIAAAPAPEPPAPPMIVAAAPTFEPPAPPVVVPAAPISEPPREIAQSVEVVATPVEQEFNRDLPLVAAALESPVVAQIEEKPATVSALPVAPVEEMPPAVGEEAPAAPIEDTSHALAAAPAAPIQEAPPVTVAAAAVAPVEEAPAAPIETPAVVAVASTAPTEAPAPAPAARAEPAAANPAPVDIAAVHAKPLIAVIDARPPPATTPQQAADIARMRAEIEAEIAREQERLAHPRTIAPATKRFVFGV